MAVTLTPENAEAFLDAELDGPIAAEAPAPEVVEQTPPENAEEAPEHVAETPEQIAEETPAEVEDPEEAMTLPRRVRLKDEGDQILAAFARQQGITLMEAAARLQPRQEPQQQIQQQEVDPEPEVDPLAIYDTEIQARADKIAALRTEANEQVVPLDQDAVDALRDEIQDLKIARAKKETFLELNQQRSQEAVANQIADQDAHYRTLAEDHFPDIKNLNSALAQNVKARIQRSGSVVASPEAIYDLVASEASKLKILPAEASNPSSNNQTGVKPSQSQAPVAKAAGLLPASAKATTTPPRHSISHQPEDPTTMLLTKAKAVQSEADLDALLESNNAPAGRLGAWT